MNKTYQLAPNLLVSDVRPEPRPLFVVCIRNPEVNAEALPEPMSAWECDGVFADGKAACAHASMWAQLGLLAIAKRIL